MLGIVIVSYKNPEMTIRFVTQELPKIHVPYCAIIVNNASTERESRELAEACGALWLEKQTVLQENTLLLTWSADNLGYAKGNNLGVNCLQRRGIKIDHWLFTNDDIEISSDKTVSILLAHLNQNPEYKIIGPRVTTCQGMEQSPHDHYCSIWRHIGWILFPFLRKKNVNSSQGNTAQPVSRETYWVSGAFFLADADAFAQAGGFDPGTFLYFEEVILSERFKMIGGKVFFAADAQVIHYDGNSSAVSLKKDEILRQSMCHYFKVYKKVWPSTIFLFGILTWLQRKLHGKKAKK